MIEYRQERLCDVRAEIEPLATAQWAELAKGGYEAFEENIDWDYYLQLERRDCLFGIMARENGRLIGYFGAMVYRSPTSKDVLTVQSTPYYVENRPNRGIVLLRMIRMLLGVVRRRNCEAAITIRTHPWASIGPILGKMGFREVATWYMLPVHPSESTEISDARTAGVVSSQSAR